MFGSRFCNVVSVNITQALADARARRAKLEGNRQILQSTLAKVEAQLGRAVQEEAALRAVAARYNLEIPEEAQPLSEEVREWLAMTRTDAVERVLKEAKKPQSPTEIVEALADKGREDNASLVSATLTYLKQQEKAVQKSRGQWVHADRPSAMGPLIATAAIAAAVMASGNSAQSLLKSPHLAPGTGAPRPGANSPRPPGAASGT
jgi:hypothetical protein